ncbi:hypothetical protein FIBSPDRAFT_934906 [Athelia psychrophila]|uniref:RNA-dependent RNA polymerase n=1 Tax=Athelia psychrophila TaxID=1759441 RepID=A0A166ELI6_9AGAM|nr:hypothetical protein FIBSPDRAFT_934906 [Fibularhizoctonia sp. CBS 109695]
MHRPVALSANYRLDESQLRNRDPLVNGRQRRASSIILRASRQHVRLVQLVMKLETIANFVENGVPHAVFGMFFREDFKAQVGPFTQWDGPDAMSDLWRYLAHVGDVVTARATRSSTREAKAMGYRILAPCLQTIREKVLQVALKPWRPTHRGTYERLGEDEIQVKSSRREFTTTNGMDTDIVLGDALVTRNPCKLSRDTRKVKAVYKLQLANYTGIIACSVKGHAGSRIGSQEWIPYCADAQVPRILAWSNSGHVGRGGTLLSTTMPFTLDIHIQSQSGSLICSVFHLQLKLLAGTVLDQFNNGRVLIDDVMSGDFAKPRTREMFRKMRLKTAFSIGAAPSLIPISPNHDMTRRAGLRSLALYRWRCSCSLPRSTSKPSKPDTKRRRIELPENMLRNHALEPGSRGPRRNIRLTDLSIEVRQDILRAAAMDFAAEPSPDEIFIQSQEGIARLRASYACLYDSEQQSQKWSRFPWDVCTRDLHDIKAHTLYMTKTCTTINI